MDSNDYIEFEGVRRYQPDALHKRMAARIAALETELIEAAMRADYWRGEHDTAAFQLQDARANIAELEAQLQTQSINAEIANMQFVDSLDRVMRERDVAQARNAELEAQLQALSVVVDGQNRKLKILLAAAAARGDGFGPVPANPTDGMSYLERQMLLDTDINEV